MKAKTDANAGREGKKAFTLIELLVVLAMIALGALIMVPALARTRTNSPALQCMSNLSQLQRGLMMYAADNTGALASNPGNFTYSTAAWCNGVMDWVSGQGAIAGYANPNTNTYYLTSGSLGPYVGRDAHYYKCPADRAPSTVGPRVRSYSMNGFVGGTAEWTVYGNSAYRTFLKDVDFVAPGAAKTFVLLEEHPDSINDCLFGMNMPPASLWPSYASWDDVPASSHNSSGTFSFADGHVELHRWLDTQTLVPVLKVSPASASGTTSVHDSVWLVARSSAPR